MNHRNNRILAVDDNRAIHDDYRKILSGSQRDPSLAQAEAILFQQHSEDIQGFVINSAFQGEEALDLAVQAQAQQEPFAMAFVDVRMPPGIDGVETAKRLLVVDPDIQIVLCSAFTDYSWVEIKNRLGASDRWVILRKPFDHIEVLQLAHSLTEKWSLRRQTNEQLAGLEQRVATRTADLRAALERLQRESAERLRADEQRRALEHKLEEAQRLESLGVLAGGIAHDFNNILTGILGSASLARLDAPAGSELFAHLARIEKNSHRAAELCEQMLAYAGKGRVSMRPLNLNDLIHEISPLLDASIPKGAAFALRLDPLLPPVKADITRIRQVILNLISNAAESLAGDARRVVLGTARVTLDREALQAMTFPNSAAPGEFVRIEVSDTGVGIAPDSLRRIFEPFFTTKFAGRGLGLSAVLGIVRSGDGAIDVQSQLGTGSRFCAYFPISSKSVSAEQIIPSTINPGPAIGSMGMLLVVDDEEAVRNVAAAGLRRLGFRVLTAADGREAVVLAKNHSAPLAGVLLDLSMPELDGVSTLKELRELRPELRAVLMSGYGQHEALERFENLGLSGFLQKPFTMDRLRECARLFGAAKPPA